MGSSDWSSDVCSSDLHAFDDAKELYLAECRQKNRPRTVAGYKRLLERHFPFGRRSVGDITPRDIQKELGKLTATPGHRHHAFTAGRAFFRWCPGQHLIERSPMEDRKSKRLNSSH